MNTHKKHTQIEVYREIKCKNLHFSALLPVALMNLLVLLASHTWNRCHVSLICFAFGTSINNFNVSTEFDSALKWFGSELLLFTGWPSYWLIAKWTSKHRIRIPFVSNQMLRQIYEFLMLCDLPSGWIVSKKPW